MTPEDVMAQLTAAVVLFPTILGHPTDDDLKLIRDTLPLILIGIPYDTKNGVHNLSVLIAPLQIYICKYTHALPILTQLTSYPVVENTTSNVVISRLESEHWALV